MKESYDIAIIGGGASGLAAAVTAARGVEDMSVAVFEKKMLQAKSSVQPETADAIFPISDAKAWSRLWTFSAA